MHQGGVLICTITWHSVAICSCLLLVYWMGEGSPVALDGLETRE